jgi:hypothetical protein
MPCSPHPQYSVCSSICALIVLVITLIMINRLVDWQVGRPENICTLSYQCINESWNFAVKFDNVGTSYQNDTLYDFDM